jgi:hypothetical protein
VSNSLRVGGSEFHPRAKNERFYGFTGLEKLKMLSGTRNCGANNKVFIIIFNLIQSHNSSANILISPPCCNEKQIIVKTLQEQRRDSEYASSIVLK